MSKTKKQETKSIGSLVDFMTKSIKAAKKEDVLRLLKDVKTVEVAGCPVPSPQFNHVLESTQGIIPYGSMIEIIGWESVGKTTLAWQIVMAELQKDSNSIAHYVDVERSGFGYKLAQDFAIDENRCFITQPKNGEEALSSVNRVLLDMKRYREQKEIQAIPESKRPHGIIVVDSIPALVPKVIIEADPDEEKKKTQLAALAALMSQTCSKFTSLVAEAGVILIFVNQWRTAFDIRTARSWLEPTGGKALRFYADMRFTVSKKATAKVGEKEVGLENEVKCIKNKLGVPMRVAKIVLGWGNGPYDLGIDIFNDLFLMTKTAGIREQPKGNTWSSITRPAKEEVKFQGLMGFKKKLLEDKELLEFCIKSCGLDNYKTLFINRYKTLRTRQDVISSIEESDIQHKEVTPEDEEGSKVKQMDDGDYSAEAVSQMGEDAADVAKNIPKGK